MISFAWPWLFILLPLPLLALLLPRAQVSRPAALRFPFFEAFSASTAGKARRGKAWRLPLALFAWLLLVIAAARPQLIGETVYLPVAGRSLMLSVDISGSMQTDDMLIGGQRMTRLAAVKQVAGDFIEEREGDRVGLILFGFVFAVNSAVHSYLILAYSDYDKVSMNVGFYYMANAGGRLAGTVLSGWVYQTQGLTGCLWWSAALVLAAAALSFRLPAVPQDETGGRAVPV